MNFSMIRYILGIVLKFESAFLLLPLLVAIIYQEDTIGAFLITAIICFITGYILSYKKPKNTVFFATEGFVTVSLSWIVLSLFGAVPFVLTGEIPHIVNALFETVSGFTTTGASILNDVEVLSSSSLFWRSFTHWIGGMGVLVFVLAIMPMSGGHRMYLMKAESPGPSVEKLVPKVKNTAMILYGIYAVLTVMEMILLIAGGMPVFDALTTSFGTAGTGGFGIKNSSIGEYAPHLQVIVTVFMIIFGVNFNIYYLLLCGKMKQALRSEELRTYLLIIFTAIVLITYNIRHLFPTIVDCIRHASFQVGSIITTTGFSTVDFNTWPELSKSLLILLMFVGACAGSTGGGMKVSRFIILLKTVKKELFTIVHPQGIRKVKIDGKLVEHETVRSVNIYMVAYLTIYALSLVILAFDNYDFTTNFTAVAATINNIGPGLNLVGPTGNFGFFSDPAKLILIFDMLAGRLEVFPMLVLLSPITWRRR